MLLLVSIGRTALPDPSRTEVVNRSLMTSSFIAERAASELQDSVSLP